MSPKRGRPAKDGVRRTIRFDDALDKVLAAECSRLDLDISGVVALILREHFGLDGSVPGREVRAALRRVADGEPRLRVAFKLLAGGHEPEEFKDLPDAIQRLGSGPAVQVWEAWWMLREACGAGSPRP